VLVELHISNLGVIDDLDLELHPGLNVLTGETGAGKTMVTLGLALALGGRASAVQVRQGSGRARAEARFLAPHSAAVTEWAEDGEVVLARTVSEDGKSGARIGGQIVPLSALASVGPELVEVHGQNQHQRLLGAAAQTELLDRFAGPDHTEAVRTYRGVYERLRRVRARIDELDRDAREREREKDLLAYQVREIEAAGIRPGEIRELTDEESRLAHAERLLERGAAAEALLDEEGGGVDRLHRLAATVREAADLDPRAAGLAERASTIAADTADLSRELRSWREDLRADPARLDDVNERLRALRILERKYGDGEEAIQSFRDEAERRLAGLSGTDHEGEALTAEAGELSERAAILAGVISEGRRAAAPALAAALEVELRELGMEGVLIRVDIEPEHDLGPAGLERAALTFSGGPRQPALPLAKSASGGELSRVMLACRSVMADLDRVPTLAFDEVDAGIGGRAGVAVGRRLARLATSRQVIVVTHLPQIACFADRHVRVTKEGGIAALEVLEGRDRVAEIARMLSGTVDSATAASHARELLRRAALERKEVSRGTDRQGSGGVRTNGEVKVQRGSARAAT
jgi:DNA repair protein RecN (Recombination protein N)